MRWQVEGADKVTGRERTYTIDADSREKAEQIALLKGVLVSDVHEPGTPSIAVSVAVAAAMAAAPIDVHGPITAPPPPNHAAVPPPPVQTVATVKQHVASKSQHPQQPRYEEIVTSARWLYGMGVVVAIVGWVVIGLAIILGVTCLVGQLRPKPILPPALGWMTVLYLAAAGLIAIYTAAVTRILASVGLAVRDMARNSFHSAPPPQHL